MIINYDRSRVTVSDKELMRHGYAEEDYHSIRLSFEYTEQQKQENRMRAESCDNAKWSEICKDSALMRSRYMERVIDKIVSAFSVYNFSTDDVPYDSDGWDLYFWCNDFFNTSGHYTYYHGWLLCFYGRNDAPCYGGNGELQFCNHRIYQRHEID